VIEFGKNSDKLDTMRSVISSVSLLLLFINYSAASKDDGKVDIDLGEMLQMGMQLGKTFLGDEGIERVKKGDFSQVVKMGEQFLGEDTMKDFMTAAADQFFQMKDNEDVMEIINGAADQILDKVQNLAKNKDKTKQASADKIDDEL